MRICNKCLAKNEDSATVCAKCGSDIRPLREVISFANIRFFYRAIKPLEKPLSQGGNLEKLFDLYLGQTDLKNPSLLILDRDGIINPTRLNVSLEPLEEDEVRASVKDLPNEKLKQLIRLLNLAGLAIETRVRVEGPKGGVKVLPKTKAEILDEVAPALSKNFMAYKAVPRLRDPEILKSYDWRKDVVDQILSFKVEKDPRIVKLQKTHLFRGLNMRVNPHSITCTNGGTGKTTFYERVGINVGKVTPPSFLGFAKSPEEIYPGTVHESELAMNVDQIESQYAFQIARHLFNILESGSDTISSGAVRFKVDSKSIFNFSANPIGYTKDPAKSFSTLLTHLTFNSAFGRRIGFILYGNDFKRIETKPSMDEIREWDEKIAFFRAVEEYCWLKLQKIVNVGMWPWINRPIPGYRENVEKIVEEFDDDTGAKDFILEHTAATARIRGGVLYSVLADNLAKIALDDFSLEEIEDEAESRLPEYTELNIKSIVNIARAWEKEMEYQATSFYESAPDYFKEVLSAVKLWLETNPGQKNVVVNSIPYKPKNYDYLSICITKLLKKKNLDPLLENTRRLYSLDFAIREQEVEAMLLDERGLKYLRLIKALGALTPKLDGGGG